MAETVSERELRIRLDALLDDVLDLRSPVVVTRDGSPIAALVSVDDYLALEETVEILSDPLAVAALEQGLREIGRGETVTLARVREDLNNARSGRDSELEP
ncbi:MAG TPA: type II toxin-antitoxin system prevent-host-death family antitoxin [Solirubrobacterales bacterium]|jgi:prevent-host-death family protein